MNEHRTGIESEFSREIDAALRKLAFHFASRLPGDRRLARRVVAFLNEIVEWDRTRPIRQRSEREPW
jgi:hypothetical protein